MTLTWTAIFAQVLASMLFAVIVSPLAGNGRGNRLLRWWGVGWGAYGIFAAAAWVGRQTSPVASADALILSPRSLARLVMGITGLLHPMALFLGVLAPLATAAADRQRTLRYLWGPLVVGLVVWLLDVTLGLALLGVIARGFLRQLACAAAFGYAAVRLRQDGVGSPGRADLARFSAVYAGLFGVYLALSGSSMLLALGGRTPTWPAALPTAFALFELVLLSVGGALMIRLLLEDAGRDARALRSATESWEQLMAIAPVGILTVARGGRPTLANSAARSLLGSGAVTDASLRASPLWPLVTQALDGRRVAQASLTLPRPEGSGNTEVVVSAVPVRHEHEEQREVLLVINDTTELRQLELLYRRSQRMEAVGRLAGGIAHDFNNLLTAILGSTHLLQAELAPDDPRSEEVREILQATERAADLTRRLLTFARPTTGNAALLDLNVVIADLMQLVRRMLSQPIEIRLELAPDVPSPRLDRTVLEQIVVNLCVNARDAMRTGGVLTVRTRAFVSTEPLTGVLAPCCAGECVIVEVADTGTGIAPDVIDHMFEPFFTTKAPHEGTGLGLATVYGLLENGGGQLQVSSTLGVGTTFTVYLPLQPPLRAPTDTTDEMVSPVTR